ncbi:MAG: anti-virulence regulator CigR family protein [Woeseiaceae bacterium]|nr:anti-virulence regulator CigR family protein [Woeseiaceae bacterium]
MLRRTIFTLLLGLLVGAGTAAAGEAGIEVVFTDREAKLIRAWYQSHGSDHGHAGRKHKGRKTLPPGIAKNLARGKPLPPGIAKQALPGGLLEILPPAPRGFERIEVAGKILLVEIATQVIHDVLEDVILG